MKEKMKPVDYMDDVNLLADKLQTVDDFNMTYKNISTYIYDVENDRAEIKMGDKIVAQYVYSGPRFYPFFVNPDLLKEALEIMKEIEVDL